ncbi:hypothetical protein V5799_029398 [Amblyomma americanum]|uniref:Uncharacterized protein n=1 Tax=Amblyomma americanum TaxID=6943 RepID=A0AAQ4ERW2_AMBAM
MSSTSKKHRNFTSEPMGNKSVTDLAGIGDSLGGRLRDQGFMRPLSEDVANASEVCDVLLSHWLRNEVAVLL